jgi:hypothetical protein
MIPGMTKNGKQKTPEWLQKALGVEVGWPAAQGAAGGAPTRLLLLQAGS